MKNIMILVLAIGFMASLQAMELGISLYDDLKCTMDNYPKFVDKFNKLPAFNEDLIKNLAAVAQAKVVIAESNLKEWNKGNNSRITPKTNLRVVLCYTLGLSVLAYNCYISETALHEYKKDHGRQPWADITSLLVYGAGGLFFGKGLLDGILYTQTLERELDNVTEVRDFLSQNTIE